MDYINTNAHLEMKLSLQREYIEQLEGALKSCSVEMVKDWDEDCCAYGAEYKRYYFNETKVNEAIASKPKDIV